MTFPAAKTQVTRACPSVTVGILTYQRPESVIATLHSLVSLGAGVATGTPKRWHLEEIIVVDNDAGASARAAVESLQGDAYPHRLRYVHEPRPGLAAARNRALDEASTDILTFIDDDELAEAGWPDGLIQTMVATGAALVGGPVRTRFRCQPPSWVIEGRFFDRPEPADGSSQRWLRSGNLAIDLDKIGRHSLRFDDRFGRSGGEDVAFSIEAWRRGLGLRWSSSAGVVEQVGLERARLGWILARERNSTTNWVRAELLAYTSSPRRLRARRVLVAGRGAVRLTQGLVVALAGLLTLRLSRVGRGLVAASRGIGSFRGVLDRNIEVYGSAAADQ